MGGETGAPARRGGSRALVGRDREAAELVAGLDDAADGRGRLLLITGDPGIGKTWLAEYLSTHARQRAIDAVQVLSAAAVVGRQLDLPLLAPAAELPVERILDALSEAVALGVVTGEPGTAGRYRFSSISFLAWVARRRPRVEGHRELVDQLRVRGDIRLHPPDVARFQSRGGPEGAAEQVQLTVAGRARQLAHLTSQRRAFLGPARSPHRHPAGCCSSWLRSGCGR